MYWLTCLEKDIDSQEEEKVEQKEGKNCHGDVDVTVQSYYQYSPNSRFEVYYFKYMSNIINVKNLQYKVDAKSCDELDKSNL